MHLSWTALAADDVCYYRVYRTENGQPLQIGSTVATTFVDREAPAAAAYAVTAVNQSGNEGPRQ